MTTLLRRSILTLAALSVLGSPSFAQDAKPAPAPQARQKSPDDYPAFDVANGGVLCPSCAVLGGVRCSPVVLDLVRMILGGELTRALQMPVGPATREVERLAVTVLEYHLERRLRSAALL